MLRQPPGHLHPPSPENLKTFIQHCAFSNVWGGYCCGNLRVQFEKSKQTSHVNGNEERSGGCWNIKLAKYATKVAENRNWDQNLGIRISAKIWQIFHFCQKPSAMLNQKLSKCGPNWPKFPLSYKSDFFAIFIVFYGFFLWTTATAPSPFWKFEKLDLKL